MTSKTVLRWLTLAIAQLGVILIAAAGGLIFDPSPLSAATEDSSAITVALAGQPAPTSPSSTFDEFDEPMVASNGNVVFIGFLSGPPFTGIFFKKNNASASVKLISSTNVMIPGAFIPDDGFDGPAISQNGHIAFAAFSSSPAGAVIRVKDPNKGTLEIVVKTGDTAPGTGGATFFGFDDLAINNKGDVAFLASYKSGLIVKSGVFLATKKGIVAILLNGDSLPGTGGVATGEFASDQDGPWLNDKDDVAFAVDDIDAFPSFEGSIFLKRGKKGATLESLLLMGTTFSGVASTSIGVGRPGLNNQDVLAFTADTSPGTIAVVGAVVPGSGPIVCANRGDTAPDTTTATFNQTGILDTSSPFGNPTISNNAVEFHSELRGDAANPRGIFTCAIFKKTLEVREAVLVSDPKPTGSWGNIEEDSSSNVWIVFVDEDSSPGPVGVFITKKPGHEPTKDKN
jgi:hypothetical protein